jgi:hypothetical protein
MSRSLQTCCSRFIFWNVRCTMLIFGPISLASTVSSFNFSNSSFSTYYNTTSTSTSTTKSLPLIKPKIPVHHNITSITAPPSGTPLSTVTVLPSATSLNDTEHSCDSSGQDCSPINNLVFNYSNGTYYNPYYNTTNINPNENQTLRDICANAFDVSLSKWLATAQITSHPATSKTPSFKGPLVISKAGENTTTLATKTYVRRNESAATSTPSQQVTTTASHVPQFPFTASQPCCYNCTISGGPFQLFQWPTQTASPPTSTYVNNLGFTL